MNFVSLESVDPGLQALAMAMSTVCIHVFGDVPSAPIVGFLQVWLLFHYSTAIPGLSLLCFTNATCEGGVLLSRVH